MINKNLVCPVKSVREPALGRVNNRLWISEKDEDDSKPFGDFSRFLLCADRRARNTQKKSWINHHRARKRDRWMGWVDRCKNNPLALSLSINRRAEHSTAEHKRLFSQPAIQQQLFRPLAWEYKYLWRSRSRVSFVLISFVNLTHKWHLKCKFFSEEKRGRERESCRAHNSSFEMRNTHKSIKYN